LKNNINKKIEVVAIIPARSGSKSIKNKNIRKINNKPLLGWAIETCIKSDEIDYFFVLTDSNYYKAIASKYGAEVPFKRPKSISKNNSQDIEFVKYSIKKLEDLKINPKLIVNIRPTTPFRDHKIVDKAIKFFLKNFKKYTSLRSVEEMSESSYKTVIIKNKIVTPILKNYSMDQINLPRQNFKKTYLPNGYVDIYKTEHVKKYNKLYGKKVSAFHTEKTIEIDTKYDLDLAKRIA